MRTNSTLFSHNDTRPPPKGNPLKYVYCGGLHYSASCESVSDRQARFEILKRDWRCYVCSKPGHQSWSCNKNCRRWHGNHHQSFCWQSMSKQPNPALNDQNSQEIENTTLVSNAPENLQPQQTTSASSVLVLNMQLDPPKANANDWTYRSDLIAGWCE